MSQVDALLFDIGGVLIEIDFGRAIARWAACAGQDPETIRARFSFDTPYERHERGEIDARAYFASLRSSLGVDLSDDLLADGWCSIYIREIPGVVPLLETVKDRIPLYAFTNSNPTHQRVWERDYATTLTVFRKIFVSSDMGLRKPEAAAFEAISREIGVPLDRILFFDDTRANVDGALAAGVQAVHVTSTRDVEAALARLSA